MFGFHTTLRLSKIALSSLLELHAYRTEPKRKITAGSGLAWAGLEWHRRYVILRGHAEKSQLFAAFGDRTGVALSGDFDLRLERPDRHSGVTFSLKGNQESNSIHFPAPGPVQITQVVFAAIPRISLTVLRATSDIITFLRTRDAATAGRLRKTFGITPMADKACILPNDLLEKAQPPTVTLNATIIVPVYNAADDLKRLLARLDPSICPILLVNDGSDDPCISDMLEAFALTHKNVEVVSQAINQGFVHSVNAGFKRAKGHVILLNSDALPPQGDWVSRILEPIQRDPTVATVTPFSNNAEIISVPYPGHQCAITPELVDQIDQTAMRISPRHAVIDLPTGIGFCMAMNSAFIKDIGVFDVVFGRGYGEEVDWCRKAAAKGGRNVALASLFVGHKGGASFGAQKNARLQSAAEIIRSRYPNYEHDVRVWVDAAQAQAQALALSLAWLDGVSQQPVPIYIGHSMGGGAETALCKEIETKLQSHSGVVILRVGGPARWRIELKTKSFSILGDAMEEATIVALLKAISDRHLVYVCGVGGRHPLDAPRLLEQLRTESTYLEVQIHDFFPISPSWNLLDSSGRFEGVPDRCSTDLAHSVPPLDGQGPISHMQWRDAWARLFSTADRVLTFSNSSRLLINEAYPQTAPITIEQPHDLFDLPASVPKGGQATGVLGSLNRAKGGEVIERLGRAQLHGRRLVVIGEMDGQFSLPKPHIVHGRYDQDKISELARSYDIGAWLLPSICPETFSFATHEALATGLPALAFARGAQGEAVAAASNGHAIESDPNDTEALVAMIDQAFS